MMWVFFFKYVSCEKILELSVTFYHKSCFPTLYDCS